MYKKSWEIMVNYKNCILRISFLTLTTGLSTFYTQKAISSEVNLDSQINTQAKLGDYSEKLSERSLKPQDSFTKKDLNLEKFCKDFPYNSRCKDGDSLKTNPEQPVPNPDNEVQVNSDSWAILTNVSTLGLGGAVVAKINPKLNARVGVNIFGFDITYEETRASYDSEVNLFNIATTLDYYPFKNSGFNVSFGAIYNNNNADGVAMASDLIDVDLGAFNIDVNDLLNVDAKVSSSRNFAPYIGVGWGNPISGGLRLWGNVGVMFPGSPEVELTSNFLFDENLIPDDIRQDIQENLDEEEESIENELERFNIYPIVSIGLSYSF